MNPFSAKENRMYSRFLDVCRAFLVGLLVLPIISSYNLTGQNSPPTAAPEEEVTGELPPGIDPVTFKQRVDLVNVLCSVVNKDAHSFITNLSKNDFMLYEDNKLQKIEIFAGETNLPLTLAMLIDTSASVAPKLQFEQEAATSFFQNVLKEKDRALLLEFDSGVTLRQDFTDDANKLAQEIWKLRAAGGTALYDAIYMVCDQKLIRESGRKAIIILSDGEDSASDTTLREAMEMALRAEAAIYAISVSKGGFFGVGDNREGDNTLKDMAEETGGKIFFPFKVEELFDAFRQISQELRSQYNLGYYSTNTIRDGKYRKLKVRVTERGLELNYRKGYYAPKG